MKNHSIASFWRFFIPLLIVILLIGCGEEAKQPTMPAKQGLQSAPVARAEFVSLRETRLMAPFTTEVLELVPEGTLAGAGDKLALLSAGDREQQLKERQSELDANIIGLERDKTLYEAAIKIEEKNGELVRLEFERRKIEHERAQETRDWLRLLEQTEAMQAGKVKLKMLQKQFEASEKMAEKGFAARQDLASHEKDLLVHILGASLTVKLIDFIDTHADEKKVFETAEALERARLAVDLASFTAGRNLSDYLFALNESQRKYEQNLLQVEEIERKLASLTVTAPGDGLLLYGDTYDGSQILKLRRGAQVYPGLTFLKIVDPDHCGVNFALDQRDALLVGSETPLFFRPDAMPELLVPCVFEAKVPVALEIPQGKPDGRTQVQIKARVASYPESLMIGFSGTIFCSDFVDDMRSRFKGNRRAVVGQRHMRRLMSTTGDVKPASASFIVSSIEGRLSAVAEEGKGVSAGDQIAVLDCEELIQSRRDSEIELKKKQEEYQLQIQKYQIEHEKTLKAIEVSRGAYEVARLKHAALLKRREEDKIIDLKRSLEVLQARIGLAQEKIAHVAELRRRGLSSELEVMTGESELADLRREHKIVEYRLKTEESGPTSRSIRLSELEVQKAALELEKAELQGQIDDNRNLMAARLLASQIRKLEMNLARMTEEIESAVVRAPADGVVILNEFNKSGGGMGKARAGDNIYARIPFMQVADVANLQVHCTVSEMDARFIKPGNEVRLLLKGNTSKVLRGWVDSVGIVAVTEFKKRQDATVTVIIGMVSPETGKVESDPALRPGSSCEVEFVLYDLPDAIYLPFDGLLPTATASCVIDRSGQMRPVKLLFADGLHGCAIASGLQAGDEILLPEADND